jgi:hypothetical protein
VRTASAWMLVILWGLAACETAPAARGRAMTAEAAALGRAAFDRRDWTAAAPLLRAAIAGDGVRTVLHLALAITASHLDRRDEATEEFQWVLAHAAPGSDEAMMARQWLLEAGVLSAAGPTAAEADRAAMESDLSGTVTWAEPGSRLEPRRSMQVHLIGLPGGETVEQRFTVRTDESGRYVFAAIPAGSYKITNAIAGPARWRLRVSLEASRDVTLDLSPDNAIAIRDDFPTP